MYNQLLPVAAILASAFLMLMGLGIGVVIIPLRAVAEGWSSTTLAWIGTSYAVAFTAGSVIIPRLVRRVGHVRVFGVIQAMLCASFLLHVLVVHPLAWAFFRAMAGLVTVGSYMIMESWINERVSNENRGAVLSTYMVVSMAGVAAGQYVAPLGSATSYEMFLVAGLFFCAALMPIALTSAQSPQPLTEVSIDPRGLFRRSPAAAVGSFLSGIIFANWVYFGPVYGQQTGFSSLAVATMLTSAMIGGMIFQFPLGKLSDRIDRRYVMIIAGLVGAGVCLFLTLATPAPQWVVFAGTFILGSVLFPVYSLAVAHANDYAEPEEFVKVSGGLLVVYGLGNMVGPQLGGRLMDAIGPSGLFVSLGLTFAAYGAYAFWRTMRREGLPAEERVDFQILPSPAVQTPETYQLDPRSDEPTDEARENV